MKSITFLRHGKTSDNKVHVMSGWSTTQLSQEGIDEIKQFLSKKLYPKVQLCFTSDLDRARDTARLIYNDVEFVETVLLRETNFGPFEGKPVEEVIDAFYALFLENKAEGEMETYQTLKQRLEQALLFVIETMNQKQKEKATVVAHNGVLRMFAHIFNQVSFDDYRNFYIKNGLGFKIVLDDYNQLISFENLSENV